MKYWYSRNAKLFFRAEHSTYGSSSTYYGYIHNGEAFKTIDGDSLTYFYPSGVSSDISSTTALQRAKASILTDLQAIRWLSDSYHDTYCCDDNDYDDNKYAINNTVTGLTINVSAAYPGSNVITITNSTDTPKTMNALLYTHKGYASNSASNYGISKTLLVGGVLFEEEITIAPGGTYTVTLTV